MLDKVRSKEIFDQYLLTKNLAKSSWAELMTTRKDLIDEFKDFKSAEDLINNLNVHNVSLRLLLFSVAWDRLEKYRVYKDKVELLLEQLDDPDECAVLTQIYLVTGESVETARVLKKPINWVRKVKDSAFKHLDFYMGIDPEE